jgi:hypothetical protein
MLREDFHGSGVTPSDVARAHDVSESSRNFRPLSELVRKADAVSTSTLGLS